MINRICRLLAVALCLAVLVTSTSMAKMFRFEDDFEYPVSEGFLLVVNNTSGSITISKQTGDKLRVRVIKEIKASSQEEADEMRELLEVSIDAEMNHVEIDTRYPRGSRSDGFWESVFGIGGGIRGSVDYKIEVPFAAELNLTTTSGDITIDGIDGNVEIEATSSDVLVRDVKGDCAVRNTSGEIRMKDIAGNTVITSTSSDAFFDNIGGRVDLRATSGNTEVFMAMGDVSVSKTSGDTRIGKLTGSAEVNSTSGNIDLEQQAGDFTLSTSSGDIRVVSEFDGGDRYEAETVSGNIRVRSQSEIRGDVRLKTVSGNIDTNLSLEVRSFNRNNLEGRVRGGGAQIYLITSSGDISLEEF